MRDGGAACGDDDDDDVRVLWWECVLYGGHMAESATCILGTAK